MTPTTQPLRTIDAAHVTRFHNIDGAPVLRMDDLGRRDAARELRSEFSPRHRDTRRRSPNPPRRRR